MLQGISSWVCLDHGSLCVISVEFLCNKGVCEGLVNANTLSGVKQETLLKKVLELVDFAQVGVIQTLFSDKGGKHVTRWRNGAHYGHFLL